MRSKLEGHNAIFETESLKLKVWVNKAELSLHTVIKD